MPTTQRYNLSKMRPIVAAYATYQGTKKAYCAQHNLHVHTFDYWRKRVAAADSAAVDSATPNKPFEPNKPSSFIKLPPLSTATSVYTLHFPDGKRLDLPLQTPTEILSHLLQLTL